jgi:hypothetical protein
VLYVHGLNPWGFSWWRRTTHENVDLNRNFRDFSVEAPRNAAYDEIASLIVPATWPPDAATVDATARFVAERGAKAWQAAISAASTTIRTASSTAATRRPGARRRCARCCATTARVAAGWPGSTCTPASGRTATASASSPVATMPPPTPAPRLVGRGHLDLRRLVDLGPAHRDDVARRLRGMPQAEYTGMALEYGTLPNLR